MIFEKKMSALIDEKNQYIEFYPEPSTSLTFDKQIHNFCLKVLQLSEYIKKSQSSK